MIKTFINNKIFNGSPTESVTGAAFIISLAGIASRLLGLVRDRILAHQFGAGDVLDAYYAAFRVPDLVYNLLILGALSAAFIPVFTGLIATDKKEAAWRLASGILNLGVLALIAVSSVLVIFAPTIMHLLTPGFSGEKIEQVILLTRIMFLSPLLLGISAIFGGILVSFKKFLVYSLAPVLYNIGIIIGALFFVELWGPSGLAWGVVLGAGLHLLIQYPAIKFSGFKYEFVWREAVQCEHTRKVFRLMLPRIMGIATNQINLLVITIFASTLAVSGSLAVFNFANNIQSVPLGLFGIAFAIAVFPTLSANASQGNDQEFVRNFSQTLRQILFFIIPLSIFIIILRAQLVRVILGSGAFGWDDTRMTLNVLGVLSLSLFAQGLLPLLTRSFYARHDTRIPLYTALVSEAVNIILVVVLIEKYQIMALAYAFTAASIVNMFLLLAILRGKFESLDDGNIIRTVFKISAASLVAGFAVQYVKFFTVNIAGLETFFGVFLQLSVSGLVGAAVFFGLCYLLRIEEFHYFKNSLTRKIFGAKNEIMEDTGGVTGI